MKSNGAVMILGSALLLACAQVASPQAAIHLRQMAQSTMERWPARGNVASSSGLGELLDGMNAAWYDTADGADYQYIKKSIDPWIAPDGSLPNSSTTRDLRQEDPLGAPILLLYRVTGEKRYYLAASRLRDAMLASTAGSSPDISQTGPFLAEYASVFQQPRDLERITTQFVSADAQLRHSMNAAAAARYMTALVDSLQYYPVGSSGREVLLKLLNRTAARSVRMQSRPGAATSLQSPAPQPHSTNCLLAYALAKGVRLGYLPAGYQAFALRVWQAEQGRISAPDEATTSEPGIAEERAGAGARLLAASEMQLAGIATFVTHQTVLVDAWFNSQERTNAAGERELFHYKWTDYRSSGFSLFGHMFRSYGVSTRRLGTAPTRTNLRSAQYYIIASPDNLAKNPQPHYVTASDAEQIEEWVRRGGVLVLMENDPANADIPHLDILADAFGLHFNNRLTHAATEYDYAMGRIPVEGGGPLFHRAHTLYMKDTCSLQLGKGATSLLTYKGDTFMGTARSGKGTVYAVTDPWLYNEYTDGRKLPPQYDNFAAGMELVRWLLQQHASQAF
jgi:unsaturated rhamnogalacturonyl hydrolase